MTMEELVTEMINDLGIDPEYADDPSTTWLRSLALTLIYAGWNKEVSHGL
jgi:hypothetical protein